MKPHSKNKKKVAVQNLMFNCSAERWAACESHPHRKELNRAENGKESRSSQSTSHGLRSKLRSPLPAAAAREFLSCIITSLTRGARAIWRGIGTGGNRNHWRQRAVLDARAEQGEGSTSEDAVRRAFRCVRVRLTGGAQSGVSGAPWTRASHSAERTEFSRQYSWIQAAWGRAHRFDLGCRVAEGRG